MSFRPKIICQQGACLHSLTFLGDHSSTVQASSPDSAPLHHDCKENVENQRVGTAGVQLHFGRLSLSTVEIVTRTLRPIIIVIAITGLRAALPLLSKRQSIARAILYPDKTSTSNLVNSNTSIPSPSSSISPPICAK